MPSFHHGGIYPAQGAERIILVRELNEAFLAKQKFPGAFLIGEDRGYPISGFDYWNSPAQVMGVDFSGATLIQRTTAGTRAMDMCRHAPELLATSFVVAGDTIKYLSSTNQNEAGLVSSGWSLEQDGPAEEDAACSRYLAAGLLGSSIDIDLLFAESRKCLVRWEPYGEEILAELRKDVVLCLQLDLFDFAMPAKIEDGDLVLRRVNLTD